MKEERGVLDIRTTHTTPYQDGVTRLIAEMSRWSVSSAADGLDGFWALGPAGVRPLLGEGEPTGPRGARTPGG